MENQTLNLSLTNQTLDEDDYVLIEQEEWAKDVGRTSVSQGVMAIGSMIFGGGLPDANCGGLNGFDTPVYVYPSRPELSYKFKVSHGQSIHAGSKTMIREEVIQCSLQDSVETDYPVVSMQTVQWIGNCYNEKGLVIGRPVITQAGRVFSFSEKVYGSLRIRYSVYRDTYNVKIEKREDSIENNFECVAFAVWDGGVEFKEIAAPSGYEDTEGNCGNGGFGDGIPGSGGGLTPCTEDWGKGTYPVAVSADRTIDIDYCSQQEKNDSTTESVESGNEAGEECGDEPIVTN